jgi:hypothetical protein
MTDQLPPSLQRFGAQFDHAARRELAEVGQRTRSPRSTVRIAAASTTALAAIALATVLTLDATTGATPAYALTNNNGSVTISLNNLTTGIPQLNARLHQMGINETVIPVTTSCPTTTPALDPGPGNLSETITIGTQNDEPAGVDGYLAAEQLPNGQIGLAIGGMKAPLPTCFSPQTMTVQPESTGSNPGAANQLTTATTKSTPPRPLPTAVRRQLKRADAGRPPTYSTTTSSPPASNR